MIIQDIEEAEEMGNIKENTKHNEEALKDEKKSDIIDGVKEKSCDLSRTEWILLVALVTIGLTAVGLAVSTRFFENRFLAKIIF